MGAEERYLARSKGVLLMGDPGFRNYVPPTEAAAPHDPFNPFRNFVPQSEMPEQPSFPCEHCDYDAAGTKSPEKNLNDHLRKVHGLLPDGTRAPEPRSRATKKGADEPRTGSKKKGAKK